MELKFRAWDDKRFTFSDEYLGHQSINESLSEFFNECWGCEIQQWVGLTDKNGFDVYLDDIIQCYYGGDKHGAIERVEFKNGAFILRHRAIPISQYLEDDGVYSSDIEVIGNMKESAE